MLRHAKFYPAISRCKVDLAVSKLTASFCLQSLACCSTDMRTACNTGQVLCFLVPRWLTAIAFRWEACLYVQALLLKAP